jgi:hypothetical protein
MLKPEYQIVVSFFLLLSKLFCFDSFKNHDFFIPVETHIRDLSFVSGKLHVEF